MKVSRRSREMPLISAIYHDTLPIMGMRITVDRAGRVVLPKPVRDKMRLTPGSTLELESEGEHITLRPVRPQAALRKELGIWVLQGPSADDSIPDLLQKSREKRTRELKG